MIWIKFVRKSREHRKMLQKDLVTFRNLVTYIKEKIFILSEENDKKLILIMVVSFIQFNFPLTNLNILLYIQFPKKKKFEIHIYIVCSANTN